MTFLSSLQERWEHSGSMLCVGLDPDVSRLPTQFAGKTNALAEFCIAIVDATAQYACAFKPQIAYFAAEGV